MCVSGYANLQMLHIKCCFLLVLSYRQVQQSYILAKRGKPLLNSIANCMQDVYLFICPSHAAYAFVNQMAHSAQMFIFLS